MRSSSGHALLVAALLMGCASKPASPATEPAGPSCFKAGAEPLATTPPAGSLDIETIRPVIRAHVADVKSCYEAGLREQRGSGGRVVVEFLVSPEGVVQVSRIAESTMGFPRVEECLARAFCAWRFPPPRGGEAVGTYPFVMTPATPR
jgi:TonB family protein